MRKQTNPADTDAIGAECGLAWDLLVEANQALKAVLDDAGLYGIVLGVVQKRAKRYVKALSAWLEALEGGGES